MMICLRLLRAYTHDIGLGDEICIDFSLYLLMRQHFLPDLLPMIRSIERSTAQFAWHNSQSTP